VPLLKPEIPVPGFIIDIARDMDAASRRLGLDCLIVGATARDLLLEYARRLKPVRATTDIDFAVAVADWDRFAALRDALLATGRYDASRQAQRLIRRHDDGLTTELDIIPFAGIEDDAHDIRWPPGFETVMRVAGYADALAHAEQFQLADDLIVRIASAPGLALMKLFAWEDRRHEDDKDAVDLGILMRDYGSTLAPDRLHEEGAAEAADYNVTHASAWLLGRHCAMLASPELHAALRRLWTEPGLRDHLILGIANQPIIDDAAGLPAESLLHHFAAGFDNGARQLSSS